MTREDMTKLLRAAADPNSAAEALTKLNDGITELFDTAEASAAKIGELTETVNGLRDSNLRLFLRVTGPEAKEQPTEEESEAEFLKQIEAKIFENMEE